MTKQCDKTGENEVLQRYFERRENGIIYVRMVMPGDLQKITPKEEHRVRQSMLTTNAEDAYLRGTPLIHATKTKWAALRKKHLQNKGRLAPIPWSVQETVDAEESAKPVILTPDIIDEIVAARFQSWMHTDDEERYQHGLDDEQFAELEQFCASSDAQMRSVISRGRQSGDYAQVVELVLDWCDSQDVAVSTDDPLFVQLVRRFAQAETQMHAFISSRNRGDSPEPLVVKVRSGERLSVMDELYRNDRQESVGAHHLSTVLNTWTLFRDFRGDVYMDEVTSADVYNFIKFHLSDKGRKWSQTYATSKVPYYLREIFGLARTKNLMTVENPASNLESMPKLSREERRKRKKPRYPLTTTHINKLLASEWYNPASDKWRGKLRQDLGVRYFGPLIQLFHGSRVREVLQLMVSEVTQIDGVWSFRFRISFDDEEEGAEGFIKTKEAKLKPPKKLVDGLEPRSLKNENVLRDIPVHPKLIELGLLHYLEQRKRQLGDADGPLFPSSLPEPGGKSPKWGRAFEQAMLRFMKDELGFANGYGNHSFRHQFEDRIRDAQARVPWPPGMSHHLSGRKIVRQGEIANEEGSEGNYGKGYQPAHALPYLETLNFSDIVLPAPFEQWLGK